MFKLNKKKYFKLDEILKDLKYDIIWINTVLKKNQGEVYVDNVINPKTAIIWHKCRNSIIIGEYNNEMFENLKLLLDNKYFENQKQFALSVIDKVWEEKISDKLKNEEFKEINKKNYKKMKFEYMPDIYWKDIEDFLNNGLNFCIYKNNEYISLAFSGFLYNNKCDIGVETLNRYKGNGYGLLVCSKIIDYCISNGIEPIWGCRSDNIASNKLAKKLGFNMINNFSYYIKEE